MFIGCSDLLRLQKSQKKIWPLATFHFWVLLIMLPAGSRSALWLIDPDWDSKVKQGVKKIYTQKQCSFLPFLPIFINIKFKIIYPPIKSKR